MERASWMIVISISTHLKVSQFRQKTGNNILFSRSSTDDLKVLTMCIYNSLSLYLEYATVHKHCHTFSTAFPRESFHILSEWRELAHTYNLWATKVRYIDKSAEELDCLGIDLSTSMRISTNTDLIMCSVYKTDMRVFTPTSTHNSSLWWNVYLLLHILA